MAESIESKMLTTDYKKDRYEILPNFRFILRVEGYFDVALKSIKPFVKENEFEQIEEGGQNDYVHLRRKHVTKPHTLQVERYLTEDFYDPVPNGTSFVLPLLLFVGGNYAADFSTLPLRTYVFFGAQVMNKEIGGFDAERSGLLTETVTIAYNQMFFMDSPIPEEAMPQPWSFEENALSNKYANQRWMNLEKNKMRPQEFQEIAEQNMWHFGKDATEYLGEDGSPRHADDGFAQSIKPNQKTKKQFEAAAKKRQWKFGQSKKDYLGNGKLNAENEYYKLPKNKVKVETLDAKAKSERWTFGPDAETYLGNGKLHGNDLYDIPQNNVTKEELAEKAKEYMYQFGTKQTVTRDGAVPEQNKKVKAELSDQAKEKLQQTFEKINANKGPNININTGQINL